MTDTSSTFRGKDLLLTDALLFVVCAFVFDLPVVTGALIVLAYNAGLVLWGASPNVVPASISPRSALASPVAAKKTAFLSLLGGNLFFLALVVYLFISGAMMWLLQGSYDHSLLAMVLHFLAGMTVILLTGTYTVVKVRQLSLLEGSLGKVLREWTLDALAGAALLLLFLFGTQLLPVIVMYLLSLGLLCIAVLAVTIALTRRSGRFHDAREWIPVWLNAALCAPLVVLILLLFGYAPFRTHFDWHSSFGMYAVIPIVAAQPFRIGRAVVKARSGRRLRLFFSATGRLLGALALGVALHIAVGFLSELPVDFKALHDLLLPVPPTP